MLPSKHKIQPKYSTSLLHTANSPLPFTLPSSLPNPVSCRRTSGYWAVNWHFRILLRNVGRPTAPLVITLSLSLPLSQTLKCYINWMTNSKQRCCCLSSTEAVWQTPASAVPPEKLIVAEQIVRPFCARCVHSAQLKFLTFITPVAQVV